MTKQYRSRRPEPAIPGDEKTHHLVPRADGMTCLFCNKTERALRAELTDQVEMEGLFNVGPHA